MPGPIIPNPIPDWLQAQNASVTDSSLTKALRMIGHLIGADNPTTQVIGLMATDLPGEAPTGGLAKAVGDLWERAKTIRAFHGSPHDFEQFSTAKIGTGEGAQAYGHGLYFAENPDVAGQYKKVLGNRAFQIGDRELVSPMGGSTRALDTQTRGENIATQALDDALNAQSSSPASFAANRLRKQAQLYPEESAHIQEALGVIADWQKTGEVHKMGGKMYEVAIKAAPEDFLDWDKPLSQQSEKVKQALAAAGVQQRTPEEMDLLKYEYAKKFYEKPYFHLNDIEKQEVLRAVEANRVETGAAAYRKVGAATPADASAQLQQAGIPGIKYLDQGSRGKTGGQLIDTFEQGGKWFAKIRKPSVSQGIGNAPADMFTTSMPFPSKDAAIAWANDQINSGTHNYVVFDDKLVDILKKYGIVLPVAGAASQMGPEKP